MCDGSGTSGPTNCATKPSTANAAPGRRRANHRLTENTERKRIKMYKRFPRSDFSFAFSVFSVTLWLALLLRAAPAGDELQAGFAETDITPDVKNKTVYMAGFGHNRKATGVHDPLKA